MVRCCTEEGASSLLKNKARTVQVVIEKSSYIQQKVIGDDTRKIISVILQHGTADVTHDIRWTETGKK